MAKYFGMVGYSETKETRPGIWEEAITEREYFGDVISFVPRWESGGQQLNDNLDVTNKISIVADLFACRNFHMMRYVTWMGAKWKVTNVEVQYPRLILTTGGVYREEEDDSA